VAARTALKAVKEYQQGRIGRPVEAVYINENVVRRGPALAA
jgi:hypothetical protein